MWSILENRIFLLLAVQYRCCTHWVVVLASGIRYHFILDSTGIFHGMISFPDRGNVCDRGINFTLYYLSGLLLSFSRQDNFHDNNSTLYILDSNSPGLPRETVV
jgi:hypothetical protein